MNIQTEAKLKEVLELLRQGNPFDAQSIISSLFENDLDSAELNYTNKCCVFWVESIKRLNYIKDVFERSEALLLEWKTFQSYISREETYEPAFFAMQYGFFSNALKEFTKFIEVKDALQRAEVFKNAGICYKKLGDFVNAKAFLSEANKIYPGLSEVIAELADCLALCGEDKYAKLFFREAFFIGPEDIDLDFLDSELIRCLISKTKEKGFTGKVLHYWIPVFGVLSGVLNIKRELTSVEVARLKKDIYAMEMEYKDPACNSEVIVPKLLNNYFWLMDHYELSRENPAKINEMLIKIKVLDSSVYDAYIK